MNLVVLVGNLGGDPELKQAGETNIAKFSVATTDGWGDRAKTNWHRITVFGKQAESCSTFLKKGSKVSISGRIDYGSYDKDDGSKVYTTDIIADRVEFLSSKSESQTTGEATPAQFDDDDIPF